LGCQWDTFYFGAVDACRSVLTRSEAAAYQAIVFINQSIAIVIETIAGSVAASRVNIAEARALSVDVYINRYAFTAIVSRVDITVARDVDPHAIFVEIIFIVERDDKTLTIYKSVDRI
jgi:hypothetical protein